MEPIIKKNGSWIKTMFEDNGGYVSSKRGLGALCLIFAMGMCTVVFFMSTPKDISGNILTMLLATLGAGTALLGITILERK